MHFQLINLECFSCVILSASLSVNLFYVTLDILRGDIMPRGRKRIENSKSELIHIRLSEKLSNSLESFCNASDLTKSEAVRLLLENFLK